MASAQILVRGKARSFDDVYEGTKLEIIGKRKELMNILASRFSVSEWAQDSTHKRDWRGVSIQSSITCKLLVGDKDDVVMITIDGANQADVVSFSAEMDLGIFEDGPNAVPNTVPEEPNPFQTDSLPKD
jgi:hypothetical protein